MRVFLAFLLGLCLLDIAFSVDTVPRIKTNIGDSREVVIAIPLTADDAKALLAEGVPMDKGVNDPQYAVPYKERLKMPVCVPEGNDTSVIDDNEEYHRFKLMREEEVLWITGILPGRVGAAVYDGKNYCFYYTTWYRGLSRFYGRCDTKDYIWRHENAQKYYGNEMSTDRNKTTTIIAARHITPQPRIVEALAYDYLSRNLIGLIPQSAPGVYQVFVYSMVTRNNLTETVKIPVSFIPSYPRFNYSIAVDEYLGLFFFTTAEYKIVRCDFHLNCSEVYKDSLFRPHKQAPLLKIQTDTARKWLLILIGSFLGEKNSTRSMVVKLTNYSLDESPIVYFRKLPYFDDIRDLIVLQNRFLIWSGRNNNNENNMYFLEYMNRTSVAEPMHRASDFLTYRWIMQVTRNIGDGYYLHCHPLTCQGICIATSQDPRQGGECLQRNARGKVVARRLESVREDLEDLLYYFD